MHAGYLPALQQTKHFVNPYPFGVPSTIYQSDHSLNGDFAGIQPIQGQEVWHEPQEDNVQQQGDEQIDSFLDASGMKRPQSGEALGDADLLEFNSAHNEAVTEYMAGISHHESISPTLFNPRRLKDGAGGVSDSDRQKKSLQESSHETTRADVLPPESLSRKSCIVFSHSAARLLYVHARFVASDVPSCFAGQVVLSKVEKWECPSCCAGHTSFMQVERCGDPSCPAWQAEGKKT
jgi:hypothetical protein